MRKRLFSRIKKPKKRESIPQEPNREEENKAVSVVLGVENPAAIVSEAEERQPPHAKKAKVGGRRCTYREPDKHNENEAPLVGLGSFIYWKETKWIFIPYDFIRACYNFRMSTVSKIFGISESLLKTRFTIPTKKNLRTQSVFPDEFRERISKISKWPSTKINSVDRKMISEKRKELKELYQSTHNSDALNEFLNNMNHYENLYWGRYKEKTVESEPAAPEPAVEVTPQPAAEAALEPPPSVRTYQPLGAEELMKGAMFASLQYGELMSFTDDLNLDFWDQPFEC